MSDTSPNPPVSPTERQVAKSRHWLPLASPLTRRILAVNVLAPCILVGGLFFLDRYKNELISAELQSLRVRAEMFAAAIGEGAVIDNGLTIPELAPSSARQMVRRLAGPGQVRARLYDTDGDQIADSRYLLTVSTPVQVEELPPPENGPFYKLFSSLYEIFSSLYDFLTPNGSVNEKLPLYIERPNASDYPEVMAALAGETAWAVRRMRNRNLLLTTAVPVQHYKQILGAVMLSSNGNDIAESLFKVRLTIFQAFAFALLITITLSLYLAGTIARPIRRLAAAADRVRRGHGRRHNIPDLTHRRDEIGELSEALRDMTDALWRRMDAISAFAADVSHELKNPLTSLRSAVETVMRVTTPEQQRKLMTIIQDDVGRLNRLISDISDASRIDSELSRSETERVLVRPMIEALVQVYEETGMSAGVRFAIEADSSDDLAVLGLESRLVQVLRNLMSNALSFSPPDGQITLRAGRDDPSIIVVEVEDDGPGIPENKLDAIFDRFYSERPKDEKFGTHSGLGLSISKQIVETIGGSIRATNRINEAGKILGARFILRLPSADPPIKPGKPRK